MKYEIIPINKLIPLEKVFPIHLKNLEEMINKDGFVLKAIIIDKKDGIILDGSHRYVYFLKNGFKTVPVQIVDYDDENIRVGTTLSHRFLIRDGECVDISKKECRKRALTDNLFPPRTTRHFFSFRKPDIFLSLSELEMGDPVDVSKFIENVHVNEEIKNNEAYIEEIDDEVEIVIQYLSEVLQTKKYLESQVNRMSKEKKICFFPGKFHPPHIGHVQTILNILQYYKKVIVGVTEDKPEKDITTNDKIISIFSLFFKNFENIEVCKIDGTLTKKENLEDLPEFDILLSGNEKVIAWAKNHNVEVEYVPRSEGVFCSGTEIRSILGRKE